MKRGGRRSPKASPVHSNNSGLDPTWLAGATDAELATTFRGLSTLPLDRITNAGSHDVDFASHTIFNDEHWKGWLPKGLVVRDIFTRLATGYAKRFWKRTQISSLYARFLSGSPGLFHRDADRGNRHYALRYVLTSRVSSL